MNDVQETTQKVRKVQNASYSGATANPNLGSVKLPNGSLMVRENGVHHPVMVLVDAPEQLAAVRKHYKNLRAVFVSPLDLETAGVSERKIYGELYREDLTKPENLFEINLGQSISVDLDLKAMEVEGVPRHLLVTANLDTLEDHTDVGVNKLILANKAKLGARTTIHHYPTPGKGSYEVLEKLIAIDVYPKREPFKWTEKMRESLKGEPSPELKRALRTGELSDVVLSPNIGKTQG